MIKLLPKDAERLRIEYGLSEAQVAIGWKMVQDAHKGVNDFARALGLTETRGYVRDAFVATLTAYKANPNPPKLRKPPKPVPSRY